MAFPQETHFFGPKAFVFSAFLLLHSILCSAAPHPQAETTASYEEYMTCCDASNAGVFSKLNDCDPLNYPDDPLILALGVASVGFAVRGLQARGQCYAVCLPVDGAPHEVINTAGERTFRTFEKRIDKDADQPLAIQAIDYVYRHIDDESHITSTLYAGGVGFNSSALDGTEVEVHLTNSTIMYEHFDPAQVITTITCTDETNAVVHT